MARHPVRDAAAPRVGPVAVLAVLIGVNVGPNLTFTGSLRPRSGAGPGGGGLSPSLARFTVPGLLTAPTGVVLATVALWGSATLLPVR